MESLNIANRYTPVRKYVFEQFRLSKTNGMSPRHASYRGFATFVCVLQVELTPARPGH